VVGDLQFERHARDSATYLQFQFQPGSLLLLQSSIRVDSSLVS